MKIIIEGEAKEIADFLLAISSQQKNNDVGKVVNRLHQLMETASEHYDESVQNHYQSQ